jgi:RecJ-like exonuclease
MKATIKGYEHLPAKLDICQGCDGTGSLPFGQHMVITNIHDWEPEEREDYFSGEYDGPCPDCDGTGRVSVVDTARASKQDLAEYFDDLESQLQIEAVYAAERRMGC